MDDNAIRVECYSGLSYAERPVAVHWLGQRLVVEQMLRSWRTPQGPGFDVVAVDGRRFRLQFSEATLTWDAQEIAAGAIAPVELGER